MNMKKNKRPTPYYLQPDYRLHEFNKRLQHKTDKVDQAWWDDLIREFFEDDATLFIQFKEKGHLRKYTIHRRLIPRYFRSLFDNGVTKVYFMVMEAKENYVNSTATLDCKHGTMVSHYGKSPETKVMTDGHLCIEFNFDFDFMRIRNWKFQIRENNEYIPKSYLNECKSETSKVDELVQNITECGMSPSTLQYLRIGVILEPMQELMAIQKAGGLNPRDSLKSALYDKWQNQLLNQDFEQRTRLWSGNGRKSNSTSDAPRAASKKRKPRKTPSVSDGKGGNKKKSPNTAAFPSLTTSDVMLVDEPMLMGGKFGDEDERIITRLENAQYRGGSTSTPPDDLDDAFMANAQNATIDIKPNIVPSNHNNSMNSGSNSISNNNSNNSNNSNNNNNNNNNNNSINNNINNSINNNNINNSNNSANNKNMSSNTNLVSTINNNNNNNNNIGSSNSINSNISNSGTNMSDNSNTNSTIINKSSTSNTPDNKPGGTLVNARLNPNSTSLSEAIASVNKVLPNQMTNAGISAMNINIKQEPGVVSHTTMNNKPTSVNNTSNINSNSMTNTPISVPSNPLSNPLGSPIAKSMSPLSGMSGSAMINPMVGNSMIGNPMSSSSNVSTMNAMISSNPMNAPIPLPPMNIGSNPNISNVSNNIKGSNNSSNNITTNTSSNTATITTNSNNSSGNTGNSASGNCKNASNTSTNNSSSSSSNNSNSSSNSSNNISTGAVGGTGQQPSPFRPELVVPKTEAME